MKRFVSIVTLALATVLCLSCSSGGGSKHFVIGFSQCANDAWRLKQNEEILQEAMFYNDIDVIIRSAGGDNAVQQKDIEWFIREGVDLLIVSPNEAAPITPYVDKAFERGIPVIVVDRKILSDSYSAFVGADNYQIGKSIGLYVSKLLHNGGDIVELSGLVGSTPAMERHDGFISEISKHSNLKLLCSRDAQWIRSAAYSEMMEVLSKYNDIDLVFCHNDDMAYGAYMAAKSVGQEKKMLFVGIDALSGEEGGVSLVLNDVLDATFIYPSGGDVIMRVASKILHGEDYPRNNTLNTSLVNKNNAKILDMQERHIDEQRAKVQTLNTRLARLSSDYSKQRLLLILAIGVIVIVILMVLVLFVILRQRVRLNRKLQQQNSAIEQQRDKLLELSKQLEDATQAKLNFFTNVSHEFKTPLTLILDPLNQVLQGGGLTKEQEYLLQTTRENTILLKDLVTQILDFRKFDKGEQTLTLSKVDLSAAIQEWNKAFGPSLGSKHIKFKFNSTPGNVILAADGAKIERIYYNLMSNALKFTPENGSIAVSLKRCMINGGRGVTLTVHNSGSYIDKEKRERIFERFYTSDDINAGTGIGLALVQAFVQMHHGDIKVESEQGEGTSFIVRLPIGNPELLAEDSRNSTIETAVGSGPIADEIEEEVMSHDGVPSVLVIDDNESIRTYLDHLLAESYYVILAKDGDEGYKKAMQYIPNLIVSDVMMPGLSGFDLCRKLKAEVQTCHIPIILLTAYALDENHVDAYEAGADSYIAKPFSSDILLARIKNLLESRVRIRTGSDDILTLSNETVKDMDREFISRFKTVIDENLSNTEMNIDFMSKNLAMSRIQLYRKVKTLTGCSPVEYLRIRRLKKAQKMLHTKDITIAEVCYETGFSSPSYFAKCYKDYYNELPSDYVRRIKLG